MSENSEQFKAYVSRMAKIRRLSSPTLDGIQDADGYSRLLKESFAKIGSLADENRVFLRSVFMPLLQRNFSLDEEETEELVRFGTQLIDANKGETLDLPIMSLISKRLLDEAQNTEDQNILIRRLDAHMDTCYALMIMTERIISAPQISETYRNIGLNYGEYFSSLLDREKFAEIPDPEIRAIVLTDARYSIVFYEHSHADRTGDGRDLELLDRLLEIADDKFYHDLVPDFDWDYFRYRTLHYYAKSTDYNNMRCFSEKVLQRIAARTEEYWQFWHTNPEFFSHFDSEDEMRMVLERNRYLAGFSRREDYIRSLIDVYRHRNDREYSLGAIYENLLIPAEYVSLLDEACMNEEERTVLTAMYRNILGYLYRMPNSGIFSSLLEYCIQILNSFIEVPGGLTFEDMGMQCMAALHPPTFLHSLMVAQISRCLAEFAIEFTPEQLFGVLGIKDRETLLERKEELLSFVYHAALCHDFGKLSILDTVFVYGRNLLDMEFDFIRTHPRTGYEMLVKHPSTRDYAEIALYHHRFFNDEAGYPDDCRLSDSLLKPVIDIVHIADCLDAASDPVGRSYRSSKSLETVIGEFQAGRGLCYADWVTDLFDRKEVRDAVRSYLDEGRKDNYRKTYRLLHDMQKSH